MTPHNSATPAKPSPAVAERDAAPTNVGEPQAEPSGRERVQKEGRRAVSAE